MRVYVYKECAMHAYIDKHARIHFLSSPTSSPPHTHTTHTHTRTTRTYMHIHACTYKRTHKHAHTHTTYTCMYTHIYTYYIPIIVVLPHRYKYSDIRQNIEHYDLKWKRNATVCIVHDH